MFEVTLPILNQRVRANTTAIQVSAPLDLRHLPTNSPILWQDWRVVKPTSASYFEALHAACSGGDSGMAVT